MISPMCHVEVIGPKAALDRTVDALQDVGMLHVEEVPLSAATETGTLHRFHYSDTQSSARFWKRADSRRMKNRSSAGVDGHRTASTRK